MQNGFAAQLELGTIICKHCQTVIGTVDTEKVTTYYSDCREKKCIETRIKIEKQAKRHERPMEG